LKTLDLVIILSFVIPNRRFWPVRNLLFAGAKQALAREPRIGMTNSLD
jgi:hypothetical protein